MSYYQYHPPGQVPETLAADSAPAADMGEGPFEVEFDHQNGIQLATMVPSVLLPCLYPLFSYCARRTMQAQRCTITDRRIVYESGWIDRSSKNIPLDRIQDVNVRQDCVQRLFGVSTLEIQTAGMGGPGMAAEAQLFAPVDAFMVRDVIMDRRDALVLGHAVDGPLRPRVDAPSRTNKRTGSHRGGDDNNRATAEMVEELRSIKDALHRLEGHVHAGVQELQASASSAHADSTDRNLS